MIRLARLQGTNRTAPITVKAYEKGNIVFVEWGVYRVLSDGETWDGPRYLNHFSNCPKADQFAEKAKPGRPYEEAKPRQNALDLGPDPNRFDTR